METLLEIQAVSDSETSSKAFSFSAAIHNPVIVVQMVIVNNSFSICHCLSTGYQVAIANKWISSRVELHERLEKELRVMRSNVYTIFLKSKEKILSIGIEDTSTTKIWKLKIYTLEIILTQMTLRNITAVQHSYLFLII